MGSELWKIGRLVALSICVVSVNARAAGYEKTVLWSGKHAGVAGAGVAGIPASQSIFFNPAELAAMPASDASVNFSPTFVRLRGPITGNEERRLSEPKFLPVGGVTAAAKICPKFGIGVGAYVAGGNRAYYNDVNFLGLNQNFNSLGIDVVSRLDVLEYALGAAYEVLPGLHFGAAWRIVHVMAELRTPAVVGSGASTHLVEVHLKDLEQFKYDAWRVGIEYDSPRGWGVGATLRSSVSFELEGETAGRAESVFPNTNAFDLAGSPATASNKFPLQINVGGYADVVPKRWRLLGEYSWSAYSQTSTLSFSGTLTGGTLGTFNVADASIRQDWKNLHIGRFGSEVFWGDRQETVLRLGYALTGQVTPKRYARATFSSPGLGHSITVGGGHTFDEKLDLDAAFEYSFASANVTSVDVTNTNTRTGEYNSQAIAVHTGVTYRF